MIGDNTLDFFLLLILKDSPSASSDTTRLERECPWYPVWTSLLYLRPHIYQYGLRSICFCSPLLDSKLLGSRVAVCVLKFKTVSGMHYLSRHLN